jgi:hypothetical protein
VYNSYIEAGSGWCSAILVLVQIDILGGEEMNGRGMGMFGFLDIRIGWLALFKMRLGCIVIRWDGDETRDPSSTEGFCIQPREWRN